MLKHSSLSPGSAYINFSVLYFHAWKTLVIEWMHDSLPWQTVLYIGISANWRQVLWGYAAKLHNVTYCQLKQVKKQTCQQLLNKTSSYRG